MGENNNKEQSKELYKKIIENFIKQGEIRELLLSQIEKKIRELMDETFP